MIILALTFALIIIISCSNNQKEKGNKTSNKQEVEESFIFAVICVREIPDSIAINKENNPVNAIEYSWAADILSSKNDHLYTITADHYKKPVEIPGSELAWGNPTELVYVQFSEVTDKKMISEYKIQYVLKTIEGPNKLRIKDGNCFILSARLPTAVSEELKSCSPLKALFHTGIRIGDEVFTDNTDTISINERIEDSVDDTIPGIIDIINAKLSIVRGSD